MTHLLELSRTAPLRTTIADSAGVVRQAASRIEDVFLVAGESLGVALSVIDEAVNGVDAIPRSIAGEDMGRASESLWRISSELAAVVEALPRERLALDAIADRLDALRAPLERLVKSIRTIAILARGARVETAHLSSDQLNFTEFAAEILTLADEAREGINAFVRDFRSLSMLLSSTQEAQATFADDRSEQIVESVSQLQSAFDAIEVRQQDAVRVSRELAERSKRISAMMGDCIMSLQAGDSTRQRLEHVDSALTESLAAGVTEHEASGQCALQAAQLADALGVFSSATGDIMGSLAALAQEAEGVVGLGQALVGSTSHGEATSRGLHEQLRHRLVVAARLIRECETARATVDAVMTSLTGTLQSFRDGLVSLQSISRSITSVGLNAAVKSFRIGTDGRGLAVISQHLRSYAEQIVDDTDALIDVFQEVMSAADVIERGRDAQDAIRMAEADAEIGAILQTIGANEMLVSQVFDGMARSGSRVGDLVRQAEDAFVGLAADMAAVTHAAAILARFGDGNHVVAPAGRQYTMSREREIYAAFQNRRLPQTA